MLKRRRARWRRRSSRRRFTPSSITRPSHLVATTPSPGECGWERERSGIVTSTDAGIPALLDAGRRCERMWLVDPRALDCGSSDVAGARKKRRSKIRSREIWVSQVMFSSCSGLATSPHIQTRQLTHARVLVLANLTWVVDSECVGACRCALLSATGINFQACSFNHSDISPF
jgi:hypothetical protein